jgi:hypothetical protein
MFCPSCGKDVSTGLAYCNQCGARLGAADPRALPPANFNMLLGSVIGIPFVWLVTMMMVIAALKNGMGFKDDFIFVMTFLIFLLFALAEIGCVIMLITRTKGPKVPKGVAISERRQFDEAARRGLGSPTFEPVPVGSVTDHTTRALDHAALSDRGE